MAADPRLRADLLKKLGGVTPQRLYQIVGDLKRNHGPMSTEDAMYVLAHQKGLDLTKYIERTRPRSIGSGAWSRGTTD